MVEPEKTTDGQKKIDLEATIAEWKQIPDGWTSARDKASSELFSQIAAKICHLEFAEDFSLTVMERLARIAVTQKQAIASLQSRVTELEELTKTMRPD